MVRLVTLHKNPRVIDDKRICKRTKMITLVDKEIMVKLVKPSKNSRVV